MPKPVSIATLLSAEREVGRLIEAVSDSRRAAIWQADGARAEILSSLAIEGLLVEWEDFCLARINPWLLPKRIYPGAARALTLARTLDRLMGEPVVDVGSDLRAGLDDDIFDGDLLDAQPDEGDILCDDDFVSSLRDITKQSSDSLIVTPSHRYNGLLDEARKLIASTRQVIEPPTAALDADEGPARADANQPAAEPLSSAWLRLGWMTMIADTHRIDGDEDFDFIDTVAEVIADGLDTNCGLAGVAAVLHALHNSGAFPQWRKQDLYLPELNWRQSVSLAESRAGRQPNDPAWRFIRLLVPFLFIKACGLPPDTPPFLFLSAAFKRRLNLYENVVLAGEAEGWGWMLAETAQVAAIDARARLAHIETVLSRWKSRYGRSKRRWQASQEALDALVLQPVVTIPGVMKERRISRQGAGGILTGMEDAGILTQEQRGKGRSWWVAAEIRP